MYRQKQPMKPSKASKLIGTAAVPKNRPVSGKKSKKRLSLINIYISSRQREILLLLHRFRFLTRPQLQQLLKLRSHPRLTVWLKDLLEKDLVRHYPPRSNNEPIIYSLGTKSRLPLKEVIKNIATLVRIKWEARSTEKFRTKCLQLADIYIELWQRAGGELHYRTNAELKTFNDLISPPPDAYFLIDEKRYFLDVLTNVPLKYLRGRIQRYADYFNESTWQEKVKAPFPTIILICPNDWIARRLNRYVKYEFADEPDLRFIVSSDRSLTKILS